MTHDLYEIRTRVGGEVYNGGRDLICPGPGHSKRDRSLHVSLNHEGRVVFHSFAKDPFEAVVKHLGVETAREGPFDLEKWKQAKRERERLEEEKRQKTLAWCLKVWNETTEAEGTPAETYLRFRGHDGLIPPVLRFHPNAPRGYEATGCGPAMVALVESVLGKPQGLHVTFLKPDGRGKATTGKAKLVFGTAKGGAIRLAPPEDGTLAVAEGIETALSFSALSHAPTWSALSAGGLARFVPPLGVRTLIVAADNGEAGMEAADQLAQARRATHNVFICAPPEGGDWNETHQMRGAA
jgi:hypothetical protein